jgi:GxxExxY protein
MAGCDPFEIPHFELTGEIISSFYEAFNTLGYGFNEPVYASAMHHELSLRGINVVRELSVRVSYKGKDIAWQRLDMVVDGCVVVEIKALPNLPGGAARQVRNYLRGTGLEVGLILNFGVEPKFIRVYSPRRPSSG